jgi:ribulose-phosphate 3-epimerase
MKSLIIPAIIAKTQRELTEMLLRLEGKAERIMLDFMDGCFVPNESLKFEIQVPSTFEYEAHLMVTDPTKRIDEIASKVDWIIFHIETLDCVEIALNYVRNLGVKVLLALNPETSLDKILPYIEKVDGVLVMTVDPGEYGARFIPDTLKKVERLREIDKALLIEVDGGMSPENVRKAKKAGANNFASGSYILRSSDIEIAMKNLKCAASDSYG